MFIILTQKIKATLSNTLHYTSVQSFNLAGPVRFCRRKALLPLKLNLALPSCLSGSSKPTRPFHTSLLEAITQAEVDAAVQKAQQQQNSQSHAPCKEKKKATQEFMYHEMEQLQKSPNKNIRNKPNSSSSLSKQVHIDGN